MASKSTFLKRRHAVDNQMANTGCLDDDTRPLAERFLEIFAGYEHVVSPSGSCVSMVRNHYEGYFHADARYEHLKTHTWELCEFWLMFSKSTACLCASLIVWGLHSSCHGLRELRLDACSELMRPQVSKVRKLLEMVEGLQIVPLSRGDECCGFGGTFAVAEEAVSVLMGADRVADHVAAGAEVMTATDASCLMHMEGIIRRRKIPLPTMHIAEILAGDPIAKQ